MLFLFAMQLVAYGQEKRDNIWLLGYGPSNPEQGYGGTKIDFNTSPPEISFFDIPINLTAVGLMCDSKGEKVLFYSGGCAIANSNNQVMLNGDSINTGPYADVFCTIAGYPVFNGIMALPFPNTGLKYCLFHLRKDNSTLNKDFLFTQIDMSQDGGLGAVTSKNEIILQDTFTSFLTALRHGNGRDWWVMLHKNRSNRSLCYLLDPGGLHDPIVQHLGPKWSYQDWSGQSVFSPDGSKYARANPYNGLHIFDFDRCAGTLSNHLAVSLAADSASACGVAFSPNSRFLYLSTGTKLFQFDMQAADIAASKQLIGVYDGFASPFPATFYQQRLAPDGKIYMAATNSVKVLHVINYPDLPGLTCDFLQHEIQLPANMYVGLPNFPYFRLYDLPGSLCDTLGINGGPVSSAEPASAAAAFSVSPNPANDLVKITFKEPFTGNLVLLDVAGRVVQQFSLNATVLFNFDTQKLPNGIYYLQSQGENQKPKNTKLVVAH